MANVTNKIFVDKMGGRSPLQYIGTPGDLFYDPAVGDLRLSDGSTPGGKSLSSEDVGTYRGFQAGVNIWRNGGDGDIAQIIIHNADGRVDYINYTQDSNNDDFYATNLRQADHPDGSPASKVVMLNLYCANVDWPTDETAFLSMADIRAFVRKFIDVVMFNEQDELRDDLLQAKNAFYANVAELRQTLPEGVLFQNFAFDDERRIHFPEYTTPETVSQAAEIGIWFDELSGTDSSYYIDLVSVRFGPAGSGFQIGDQITLTGDQLGGRAGVNDLVLTVAQVKDGGVLSLELIDGGTGFIPNSSVDGYYDVQGEGGCGIRITDCTENGTITGWVIRNGGGEGYQVGDTLTLTSANNDTATFEVLSVGDNGIASVTYPEDAIAHRGAPTDAGIPDGYWPRIHIQDGEEDQYDNGNWISTSASTAVVVADLTENKMVITSTDKTPSVGLTRGMLCTVVTGPASNNTFRLVSLSDDNDSVWFTDGGTIAEGATVRIDGIRYRNGDVRTDDAFGTGSSYVTLYSDSIFAMMAFGINVDSVYYNGEMGADGNGYKTVSTLLGARNVDYIVKTIAQTATSQNTYEIRPSDAGKHIYHTDTGSNTVTLTDGANQAMPVGTAITIVSGSDGWTYINAEDSETIQIWGAGLNISSNWFYIPENSMATLLKIGEYKWMLSGAGLGIDD